MGPTGSRTLPRSKPVCELTSMSLNQFGLQTLEHHAAGPGRYDGSQTAGGGPPPKSTGRNALTFPPSRLAGGQNYSVGRRMNRRTVQQSVTDALQVFV